MRRRAATWRSTRLRESLAALKLVAQGEADVAAGHVVSQAEAFRHAEAVIARAQPSG